MYLFSILFPFQQLYAGQQAVQHQIQQLLTNLQPSSQPSALQQIPSQPAAPPPIPNGSHSAPTMSNTLQSVPIGPLSLIVMPPLVPSQSGWSLASYFPDMKPVLLLAIMKHDFDPGQYQPTAEGLA